MIEHEVHHQITQDITSLAFSSNNILSVGSWDMTIHLFKHPRSNPSPFICSFTHDAPVLCTEFITEDCVLSGGADGFAKMWSLSGAKLLQSIPMHNEPIKVMQFEPERNLLITGSWDGSIKFWDFRSATCVHESRLKERVYALDVKQSTMVCGLSHDTIACFDLVKSLDPTQVYTSPLNTQTRDISIFPDRTGFVIASIQGRCAVHHVNEADARKNFKFKCHRNNKSPVEAFSVHSVDFHPLGTFLTSGGDGAICFWDKDSRQRLKQVPSKTEPILVTKFDKTGNSIAFATGNDWAMGTMRLNETFKRQLFFAEVENNFVQPRK